MQDVLGQIDWENPLTDHPLNIGRQLWLLVGEDNPLWGGTKLYDLASGYNALLTNFAASVNPWVASYRSGGFGALRFDGTDDLAVCTDYKGVTGTGARTTNIWFRTTDTDATAAANNAIAWGVAIVIPGELHNISIENGVAWARYGIGNTVSAGSGYNDGNWHMLTIVQPAGATVANVLFYVDAVSLATTTAGSAALNTGSADVRLGYSANVVAAAYFLGDLDDASIWNRVLTAAEIYQLYRESIDGYPNTLRRVRRNYSAVAQTAAATPWLYRPRHSQIIGGGVL